jgi:hypothetical protein
MSLPIHSFNLKSIDAADLSASQTGSTIDVREVLAVATQVVWSGGSSTGGTLYIEASIDNSTFTTLSTYAVATNSGSYLLNAERAGYLYIRTRWVASSGTGGTISSHVSGKRL